MATELEDLDRNPAGNAKLKDLFDRNYRKVVYYFLRARLGQEEAQDLAQETFLRAHRGWDGYRGEASEETWLFEIAKNILKNWYRKRSALKNQRIEVSIEGGSMQSESDEPPEIQLQETSPSPAEQVLRAERNAHLQSSISRLSPHRRQCVELRLLDLSYQEIAVIMGISIETVKSHLYQAREALRLELRGLE